VTALASGEPGRREQGAAVGGDAWRAALETVAEAAEAHAAEADVRAAFPEEAVAAMRATGLLGLLVPRVFGGYGGDVRSLVEASIRLGRADLSTAMVFAMHCQQVGTLVRHADERLRRELLPEIAVGGMYLGSVTTEVGKGGRLLSADSPLDDFGDALALDRRAPVVTGGRHADGFLLTMRSPAAETDNLVSLVFARRDQLTVEDWGGAWDTLGMRASDSGGLRLRGRLPRRQLIGRDGCFREISIATFAPLAHLGWSACWLGSASGALARTLTVLRQERRGRAGADGSELLAHRLSGVRQQLDTVYALLAHCCTLVEREQDLSRPRIQLMLNALKLSASEATHRAVEQLVEVVGMRHGYLRGSPTRLERVLRDLRSATLNFHNDRLHAVDGRLAFLDPGVGFAETATAGAEGGGPAFFPKEAL
jgi:acyl-CoA dehydrogenase